LLKKLKYPNKIAWFFIGMAPLILFLLFYNYEITGNMLVFPSRLADMRWGLIFRFEPLWNAQVFLNDFVVWTPPGLLIAYLVYLPDSFKNPKENIAGLFFIFFVAGYLLYSGNGGDQYGPRYYYEVFPFLALFVVSKLFKENNYSQKDRPRKLLFFVFVLSLLIYIPISIYNFSEERKVIWERRELYRLVESSKIKNAIIFLKVGTGTIRPLEPSDLTRNGVDYSNDVLYVCDRGKENYKLAAYFHGRNYYVYSYNINAGSGILEKYNFK